MKIVYFYALELLKDLDAVKIPSWKQVLNSFHVKEEEE